MRNPFWFQIVLMIGSVFGGYLFGLGQSKAKIAELENPALLSKEDAICKIQDLFQIHNFVGAFFTEVDIRECFSEMNIPLTDEQVVTFCKGRTWNKVLEQVMCEEGFAFLSIAIADKEHLGK